MTDTVFSINPSQLELLDQNKAVDFVRKLLWAEASRLGMAKHLISVPSNINVGDGGIDASVKDAVSQIAGFIPSGDSGFQVKATKGENFGPAECVKELHVGKDPSNSLKPGIVELLDRGGKYYLVIFDKLTEPMKDRRTEKINKDFSKYGYGEDRFEIIDVDQLVGYAEDYPSLVFWFNDDASQGLSFSAWSGRREIRFPNHFAINKERKEIITDIRSKMSKGEKCEIVRVIGLSGLGKTRLVNEALSTDEFRNRVVYTSAAKLKRSSLQGRLESEDNLHAIVVVDECSVEQHREFVSAFSERGGRLGLITISNDFSKVPFPALTYKLSGLEKEKIKELIMDEFEIPRDIADRLADFADGYPGIACDLAFNYKNSDDSPDEFINLSDTALINRLISGEGDSSTDYYRKTKKVLTGIAVFSKVGYRDGVVSEKKWLCEMLEVSEAEYTKIVEEQRSRGLVEGDYFTSVRPFMLKVTLFVEWWEEKGFDHTTFADFSNSIPEEIRQGLIGRLVDNIPFLGSTSRGQQFVKSILSSEGIFSDEEMMRSRFGADFFLKLAQADAESALSFLSRTVLTWSNEKLTEFSQGRREVVWALEAICMWRELFVEGARVLFKLAVTENETVSNNATGVLTDLFSPGPGGVAPTEASLEERYPVLEEIMSFDGEIEKSIAIKAIGKALETTHFSRTIGAEHQGLRREPELWRPKNNEEHREYFGKVWKLLSDNFDKLLPEQKIEALTVISNQTRGLIGWIPKDIMKTLKKISGYSNEIKKEVISTLTHLLHYDGKSLEPSLKEKISSLKKDIEGSDFPSRLVRYVGMQMIEDEYDEEGNRVDNKDKKISELAKEAISKADQFKEELKWIVTGEAQNGFLFGYHLGLLDDDFELWDEIITEIKNNLSESSDYFVGGYLKAVSEIDVKKKELFLDKLGEDVDLVSWIPDLTWRSGLTEFSAKRILKLGKEGLVSGKQFRVFGLGSSIKDLSEEVFIQWIDFLIEQNDAVSIFIALDLIQFYYLRKESKFELPESPTFEVIISPKLYEPTDELNYGVMSNYNWTEVAKKFVNNYPDESLPIAELLIEKMGEKNTIFSEYSSKTLEVLNMIATIFPVEVWRIVVDNLGPPIDNKAFRIKHWLRGGRHVPGGVDGGLSLFLSDDVFAWVDENPKKRAWYLTNFVPKLLFRIDGKVCWAREVLVRYGHIESVRKELNSNFWSEGFSGPASSHYQRKIESMLAFKKDETDKKVILWIDEFVKILKHDVKRGKMEEELRGF